LVQEIPRDKFVQELKESGGSWPNAARACFITTGHDATNRLRAAFVKKFGQEELDAVDAGSL